jgi:hypothetical protein
VGPIGRPEKLVRNYHYSLHNNPEERNSQAGIAAVLAVGIAVKYPGSKNEDE